MVSYKRSIIKLVLRRKFIIHFVYYISVIYYIPHNVGIFVESLQFDTVQRVVYIFLNIYLLPCCPFIHIMSSDVITVNSLLGSLHSLQAQIDLFRSVEVPRANLDIMPAASFNAVFSSTKKRARSERVEILRDWITVYNVIQKYTSDTFPSWYIQICRIMQDWLYIIILQPKYCYKIQAHISAGWEMCTKVCWLYTVQWTIENRCSRLTLVRFEVSKYSN